MAKQNRFANQAANSLEVAGRKLRTNTSPDHVRRLMRSAEERLAENPQALDHLHGQRGATWEAMRLKGLIT